MNLEIRAISKPSDIDRFVEFPFKLYRGDPYWVPPLKQSELAWLTASKNPAFEHSEVQLFTAWRENEMVGRIAVIVNHLETERLGTPHARFGWLDFIDDQAVSGALLQAVETWAKTRKCTRLKGPCGFNSLDKNGMLVEGFKEMGAMTTLYNHSYYPQHLEAIGYEKELEWLEMRATLPNPFPEKIAKAAALITARYKLRVHRPKSRAEIFEFGKVLFQMLFETYNHLPTFVPISQAQQTLYIKNYLGLLPPNGICVIMTEAAEPIGFGITMPSLSKAMQKAGGRLFPFGFVHLLLAQYFNKSGDLTLIGVKEEWRNKGIHSVIFTEIGNSFLQRGYTHFNVNPMLEQNTNVLSLWKDFDYRVHKRRRTYFKDLPLD